MPILGAANFKVGSGVSKRTLARRLQDRWLNVKEFGALGNGTHDDTDGIKAALEKAYGTAAAPHGSPHLSNDNPPTADPEDRYIFHTGNLLYTNKPVYFPPGDYKVTQPLSIPVGYGVNLIGAGSYQSRIFWDGPEVPAPAEEAQVNTERPIETKSSLLCFYHCWHSQISGLTLDASGVQEVALRLHHWPPGTISHNGPPTPDPYSGDDGSGGYYEDVHFTGGTFAGFISAGSRMGSERTFVFCRFTNNTHFGHFMLGQNALNHNFHWCQFADQEYGMSHVSAGQTTVNCCTFQNHSFMDIHSDYGPNRIVCNSGNGLNFACSDGVFIGNTHTSSGGFFNSFAIYSPAGPLIGCLSARGVFLGNHSTNSTLGDLQQGHWYFKGNDWDNANFYTAQIAAGRHIFVDGTDHNPVV